MKKKLISKDLFISMFIVITLIFLTLGYASLGTNLGLNGAVTMKAIGKVKITNIKLDSTASGNTLNDFGSLTVDEDGNITLTFSDISVSSTEKTYKATYLVTVKNFGIIDYVFTGLAINADFTVKKGSLDNSSINIYYDYAPNNKNNTLSLGDTLSYNDTGVVAIVLNVYVGSEGSITIDVEGEGEAETSVDNSGSLLGTINKTELDLSSTTGTSATKCFDVSVINTFKYNRILNLTSSNSNFYLTDSDGESLLSLEVPASSNNNVFNVCLNVNENAVFLTDTAKTSIILSSNEIPNQTIGSLDVTVDVYEAPILDDTPPEIGNLTFTVDKYDTTTSSLLATVSWNLINVSEDDTAVNNYHILLYDATGNSLVRDFETGNGNLSYSMILDSNFLSSNETNMVNNNHDYYVKVYGIDDALNSGQSYCSTTSTHCPQSSNSKMKWKFNINTSGLSNMSLSTDTTAYLNNPYTGTLKASTNYNLPLNITVTMGGVTLESGTDNDYTYSSSSATNNLKITKLVTGDITLTGTASSSGGGCLVSGTKIRTAKGDINVEDITYKDLLVAYSYELGREVYEYPIAIEHGKTANNYLKITFSDDTYLDIYYDHGIFSVDDFEYISVLDKEKFHIGTRVLKINNNEFNIVSVKNIQEINDEITYYNITSTRYLNVIANDLLTTDYLLPISNIFPFDEKLTWKNDRYEYLKTNDFIPYEILKNYFPLHIYKGARLNEAKYLLNQGKVTIEYYVKEFASKNFVLPYMDNNYNNLWPVSTSDDLLLNNETKLYKEGSTYTLDEPINVNNKKFIGWYNTADNKYYNIGDNVTVDYGIYFEAVWE